MNIKYFYFTKNLTNILLTEKIIRNDMIVKYTIFNWYISKNPYINI